MTIRSFTTNVPQISKSAFIDPTALVIGKVTISDDSSIWPMTVIRGDVNEIKIGCRSNIQDGSVLHVTHAGKYTGNGLGLYVGDDVTVGHRVILHACTIENTCLIGMGATILDGATIQSEVIIGANSLITSGKNITSGLWVGSPAQKIRDLTTKELEFLKYSAKHYVNLKNLHQQQLKS